MGLFGKIFGNDDIPEVDPLLRRAIDKQKELRQDEFWKGYADGYKKVYRTRESNSNTMGSSLNILAADVNKLKSLEVQVFNSVGIKHHRNMDAQEIYWFGEVAGGLSAFLKYIVPLDQYTLNEELKERVMKYIVILKRTLQGLKEAFKDYPEVTEALFARAVRPIDNAKNPIDEDILNAYKDAIVVLRQ